MLIVSEMHWVCEPDIIMIPLSVGKRTAESSCVIPSVFMQMSRVIGCRAMYVPLELVSIAQTPSSVKA